jgi:hypothetical protein
MKKLTAILTASILVCALFAGSVFAFSDLDPAEKEPIMQLKERGIVSGMDNDHFVPRGKISFAESISLIVKGLNLNIDHMRFVKKPEASDYFTNVPNDAWYAEAFIIAKMNRLNIPKDADPTATMTREQYADLLIHALDTKGSFPVIKMLIIFADADQVDAAYKDSMQRIYLHKLAVLGDDQMAYPKREMTRGEAAIWLNKTLLFVESQSATPEPAPNPQPVPAAQGDVTMTVEPVNAEQNKVTLSRGDMPNPGYRITIDGVSYENDGRVVITYTLVNPAPGGMYAQVITEAKAETLVKAGYKPVAVNSAGNGTGTGAGGSAVDPSTPVSNPTVE